MIAQVALTVPRVRQTLSYVEGKEHFAIVQQKTGELTLTIQGIAPSEDIRILQNGQQIGTFAQSTATVPVQDNSVIEVDGCNAGGDFTVLVSAKSSNINTSLPAQITISHNIGIIGRVFVK